MNKTHAGWTVSNQTGAEYIGILEIEGKDGECHDFDVLLIPGDRYIFGGCSNAVFLESGYMLLENDSWKEMEELYEELTAYYTDGPTYAPRLVCNNRM